MPLSLLTGFPCHRNSVRAIHSQTAKGLKPYEACRRTVQCHWKRQWPRQRVLKRAACTREAPNPTGEATPEHTNCSSSLLWQGRIQSGNLQIAHLEEDYSSAAMVLLTRAFADAPDSPAFKAVVQYVEGISKKSSDFLLGAYLAPDDPALLPPGRNLRLIGVAAVSLNPKGHDTQGFRTPHQQYQDGKRPLDNAAYISSMAVDRNFRRQGVASALLEAAEACVRQAGLSGMYLTALQRDEAAQQLYLRAGFEVLARQEPGPIAFLNVHRKALKVLMAKSIPMLSSDAEAEQ